MNIWILILGLFSLITLCISVCNHFYLRPPRRLCNRWHLSVCVFVSEQRNLKTYWWIFFKFSYIVYICLSKSWVNFGVSNVTVATLKFMRPLPGRRSVLYECNSLAINHILCSIHGLILCLSYDWQKKYFFKKLCPFIIILCIDSSLRDKMWLLGPTVITRQFLHSFESCLNKTMQCNKPFDRFFKCTVIHCR